MHGAKRPPHGCRTVLPINATTQSPPAKRGAGPGHRHLWTADNMGGTASLPGYHDVPHKRGPLNRSPEGCLSGSYRPPPRPTDGSVILSGMANVPHAAPDAGSQLRGSSSGPTSIGVASSAENGFRGMHHLGLGSR